MFRKRIVSVDIFRGMTIALMILVNNPGTWSHIYSPFKHAEWFGVTPTDWVFPFFLFIVGTSIVLAYHNRPTDNFHTWKRIFSRTLKLLFLSWFLAGFKIHYPFFKNLHELRIPGVLFRIALVFFVGAVIFLTFKWIWKKFGFGTGLSFLIFLLVFSLGDYWYVMVGKAMIDSGLPKEEIILQRLDKSRNLASEIDRKILGIRHMWRHWDPEAGKTVQGDYDPEGLLSTIPAVATAILGMLLGLILIRIRNPFKKWLWIILLGIILLLLAKTWEPWFPFSKKLWTSSYVLHTGGLAFLFFGLIYFIVDLLNLKKWALPFVAMGMNAIAIFVLNGLIAKTFYQLKISGTSVHWWIYHFTWAQWLGNGKTASLLYALSVLTFYVFLALYLYRKKIFIKV